MKISKLESLCAVIVCLLMGQIQEVRANAIITNPGPGTPGTVGDFTTLGYDFTVGSTPLLVTSLGLWDQNQNGFTNGHTLGLWDTAGNLLAIAGILPGTIDPLVGEFRYVTLGTSVTLLAGTTYVLGATYLDQDADRFIINLGGNQATFDSAVTPGNARGLAVGFVFPSISSGPGSFVGPNAQFTLVSNGVPEAGPGVLLISLALVGLLYVHRQIAS